MGLLSEGMVLEEVQVGNGRERNGIMGFRMKGTGGIKAVVSRWGEEGQGGAGEGIVALLATNVGQVLGCGHQLMQYGTKYTLPLCINQIQNGMDMSWPAMTKSQKEEIERGTLKVTAGFHLSTVTFGRKSAVLEKIKIYR